METIALLSVALYLLFLIGLGIYADRIKKKGSDDYFLASRGFRTLLLFFTMTATNFSAFFFLGFPDSAYRLGFGQYGIMALGTAFMPIMFYILGRKAWKLGKEKGYTTAPELIGGESKSKALQVLTMLMMVIFTIPYLTVQAVGGGYIIAPLTGISAFGGALVITLSIAFYVSLGGMRASGWTDMVQGIFMFSAMILAGIFIASALGGLQAAGESAYSEAPELFVREGGYFTVSIWFSFMVLWILADPMFPQLFSRFYTAKDEKALKSSMILYPFVISFLFLIPVLIGVWARGAGIEAGTNQIMIAMIENYTPKWLYYLVMLGALSALMSTADSQLFSISTMFVRDLNIGKRMDEVKAGMLITWLMALFTIITAYLFLQSGSDIMSFLLKNSFSGLAVLAPAFIYVLYSNEKSAPLAMISIIAGEVFVVIFAFHDIRMAGLLPGVVAIGISGTVLVAGHIPIQKIRL